MMRSRPVKFMLRAPVRARSSESAVKSAMDAAFASPPFPMGTVTASDSGRRRRPWQRGHVLADMYCIMYSR